MRPPMGYQDGYNTIIISDLHLSAGQDPRTGEFDVDEHFRSDGAFARFLDSLSSLAAREGHKYQLLVLGDMLDFLRVDLARLGRDLSEFKSPTERSLAKLEIIARGHPEFFRALGIFAAAGFPVHIVPGNHDIELMRPAVQAKLKQILVRSSGHAEAGSFVEFYPWIFHVPDLIYAEHGHQYHDINSFTSLLRPYAAGSDELDLPIGSRLDGYLSEIRKSLATLTGNRKPARLGLLRSLIANPGVAVRMLPQHGRFLRVVLTHLVTLSGGRRRARRKAYHDEVLRTYSRQVDLSYESLVALDQLSDRIARSIKRRLLGKFVEEQVMRRLPRAAAPKRVREERGLDRVDGRSSVYLRQAALGVHRLLSRRNEGVPYYLFGHSHIAEQRQLGTGSETACYINSGTWTQATPEANPERASDDPCYTFTVISKQPGSVAPAARLMRWDDAGTSHEELVGVAALVGSSSQTAAQPREASVSLR